MQLFTQIVSLAITVVAVAFTARAVTHILRVLRAGQPASRTDSPAARTINMLKETLGHTRMLQWHWIGVMHWFIFAAFLVLSSAVMSAYFELFDPKFEIPILGHSIVYQWVCEFLGLFGTIGIIVLIIYRQVKNPSRLGRRSRFFGSSAWQAYFVEFMVLLESAAILFVRGAEFKLLDGNPWHFPLSQFVGKWFYPDDPEALKNIIFFVAMIKIVSAMAWLIVISSNLTMGVAWHRFTAWFNIWFKRESSGRTALGALSPMMSDGKPVNFEDLEDMDEETTLGVGKIEDFTWKDRLDFTTCTECGRCQSQCPAWNTEKPLSPKLLTLRLRDHAYAKAPYSLAKTDEARAALPSAVLTEAERPLVGATEGDWAWDPTGGAVIDDDVLWSCTSCGACVQQCPVDIEHVDHIVDMRRYQVLVESNFPAELNGLFKGLENKGNPWNMNPNSRMEWAAGLDFDVKVVGEDVESLDEVEWLFWVGCAGAYEDRAKKTTRAVAELLNMAGVEFAVLGNGETCTGDPARRAGNEFVFQGLATQNVEVFKETKVKKVVSTCAHCFNTLKNEYKDFGIELEVTHHTQLLNRLVREKKLTPVAAQGGSRSITYHDPCYLGRHNQVYSPPRELLTVIPGAELKEMPRNSERSFCCGAGGARMWMEETIGERINVNRTQEAVATGADQIAVGCPFCRVMLSDGLTAIQAKGEAREEVEVLDVAQLLLASVKGEAPKKKEPSSSTTTAAPSPATSTPPAASDPAPPEPAPTPPAQTGGSLFDTAGEAPATSSGSLFDTATEAPTTSGGSLFDTPEEKPATSGGSLFDTVDESSATSGGSLFDTPDETPAAPEAKEPAAPESDLGSGGSLFDLGGQEASAPSPAASESAVEATQDPAPAQATDKTEASSEATFGGGSLFDIVEQESPAQTAPPAQADTPADESDEAAQKKAAEKPASSGESHSPKTDTDISGSGSLFDL
ncbi:MAG TPA: heterodisulfide reductase-related iron-sulfur binding cluster [Marmoricola sp.]|nr:4Fe-4S dicluster domain-containing protein [Nocardioidaceae bacterium]HRV68321.1 heterodisulfide reductase-related iron-sulfur binding cluster [Marmoricola sp.]